MYRAAVKTFCLVIAWAEVAAVAGLITQTPHNNACVVAVAQHHAVDAVNECRNPRLAVRETLVCMVLKVGLIATVKTIVVIHRVHSCRIGVVACAYGVDVVLLHEDNILQH